MIETIRPIIRNPFTGKPLRGVTKITLEDVITKKKTFIEKENMLTNAIPELFNDLQGMNNCSNYLPLYKNFGGVYCFEDVLAEDPTITEFSSSYALTAHAGDEVNSGADTKRGSPNLLESGKITGGYKFVWDWNTAQGNGLISTVCLTTNKGGNIGGSSGVLPSLDSLGNTLLYPDMTSASLAHPAFINFAENYTLHMSITGSVLTITKNRRSFTKIYLLTDMYIGELISVTEKAVSLFSGVNNELISWCEDDMYYYGVTYASNSSGNASVKVLKITKSDFTVSEDTLTLTGVTLYALSSALSYNHYQKYPFMNGYIYLPANNRMSYYKININNASDVTLLSSTLSTQISTTSHYGSLCLDGVAYTLSSVIHDDIVEPNTWFTSVFPYQANQRAHNIYIYQSKVYDVFLQSPDSGRRQYLFRLAPLICSINLLDIPITKTATQTMKIEYSLTEVEA